VFVSPLRRALQTAHGIFETHPNRKIMKFVVIPYISEGMREIVDFPRGTFEELKKEF
jgi:hypothetical protein